MKKKRGLILKFFAFLLLFFSTLILRSEKTVYLYPQNLIPQVDAAVTYSKSEKATTPTASAAAKNTPATITAAANEAATTQPVDESYKSIRLIDGQSMMSIYIGPGAIAAHNNFEQWLGKAIPYATDYIDYKGGWQKDFIDSKLWLMEPWGRWVRANPRRRLVLGLPMLESANYGQFSSGANGDFDLYFMSLGNELVKQGLGNTIIRLGYEANCDTIGPWQATNDPNGYKLLFRHLVGVMKNVPGSNFLFDWTVCNGLQAGKALNSFESFYPGNDVVDMIGIDIYDVKWKDTSVTPQQRWEFILNQNMGVNPLLTFARGKGKPITIPEWGLYRPGDNFSGGGDNPYFIYKMTELINNTSPVYQSYFNLDWGGGILRDFSSGEAVFRQIFGI